MSFAREFDVRVFEDDTAARVYKAFDDGYRSTFDHLPWCHLLTLTICVNLAALRPPLHVALNVQRQIDVARVDYGFDEPRSSAPSR